MNVVEFQCRPIDQWPGPLTRNRKRSTFSAGYGTTVNQVYREVELLGAKSVVLLMALVEDDIRLDGRPRANAKPSHPGVILVVETKDGTLRFPCDTYDTWSANLRAIGLTLDALRRISRYGATRSNEQYTGWKALPAPGAATGQPTEKDARNMLTKFIGGRAHTLAAVEAIRESRLLAHPDKGGNTTDFQDVQIAARILGVE